MGNPIQIINNEQIQVAVNSDQQLFQHSCLKRQTEHIQSVTNEILSWVQQQRLLIKNASDASIQNIPNALLMYGPMAAGKSSVLALAVKKLIETNEGKVFAFGLKDNRDPRSNQIYNRNNVTVESQLIDRSTNNITVITNKILMGYIPRGSVIFISEAQFLADSVEQLDALIEIAKSAGIIIVFDCLDKFYNGQDIPMTAHLKKNIDRGSTYKMFACDTFSDGSAYNTLRFVRLGLDGNFIAGNYDSTDPRYNDGGHYLASLTPDERQIIVNKILCDPGLTRFILVDYVLIPSHATDDAAYVPGAGQIYVPGNIAFIQEAFSFVSELKGVLNSYNNVSIEA